MVSYPAPRLRIEVECGRRGQSALVAGCVRLLRGGEPDDTRLLLVLGGPHAEAVLADGLPDVHRYWLRVWAARGPLWAWDDGARSTRVAGNRPQQAGKVAASSRRAAVSPIVTAR